ncbi:MAG TPA: M24 family metallopeptidase [Chloroflexota bacterium]|nr:M24 family metallopeptidase [Chloroflexota bacterium]
MIETWSPDWSNAVFSLEERDRRWANVRRLMSAVGVDLIVCLPNSHSHDKAAADTRYLTQLGENSDEVTAAFPVDGEVTAWLSRGGVWPSSNWFTDIRVAGRGSGGRAIVNWIKEHPGYESATIAIAGLDSSLNAHVRALEGEVNWGSVELIKQAFPKAKFVSATPVLGEARFQKSAEEIDFLRKGTRVAEETMGAILEYAREGVPERDVFGRMMYANAHAGGSFTPMFGWISGPLGNTYHRVEQPTFRSFQRGDVLSLEIEGRWAGYVAQIDQTFSIGPAHEDLKEGMKLCCEAFNRVMDKLKPGVTCGELVDAAKLTGLNGRAMSFLTMHGRGAGDEGPPLFGTPPEEVRGFEIKEGCCFVVKPATSVDGKPDYGRWGDSVVVTKSGAERLGARPQQLYELG